MTKMGSIGETMARIGTRIKKTLSDEGVLIEYEYEYNEMGYDEGDNREGQVLWKV